MKAELKSTERGLYSAGSIAFDGKYAGARIRFGQSFNTSLAYVYADDKLIGVGALSSYTGDDTAYFAVDKTDGTHELTVKIDGFAALADIELTEEAPGKSDYVPTPESKLRDIDYDTWEATDMLGRHVSSVEDVGAKKNRKVGIFYWTWHELHTSMRPVDVVDVLAKYPAAEYNIDHPAWGPDKNRQYFWHQPLYGYYRDSDPYVIRRHMSMLADAGVDFLLFDCTNGALLWRPAYEPLLAEMHRMREDGVRTPQIGFMMNFCPMPTTAKMIRSLYQDLYKPGLYSDLWFRVDGKPFMMCYPSSLPETGSCESETAELNEIKSFFTFRPGQPGYGCGPQFQNQWGWLEKFPQHKYVERPDGSCEMMTVGVSQNANDERICTHFNAAKTYGRSYTHKYGHGLLSPESYKYGYNFQEQWDRVIDIGPDIAFITGWNEWIMGAYHDPWLKDDNSTQMAFVDEYDREHSRDIEPDRDGQRDTYYLQMVSNIRRFKGAGQRSKVSEPKTVNIRAGARQWKDVSPLYECDKGTTIHRDWDGFKGCHYVNTTGRNDIVSAKVTRDADNVYFMVQCAQDITAPAAENWMTLFIDTDREKKTGWEGYDYVINRKAPVRGKTSVEKYLPSSEAGSFTWETVGKADISVSGNMLQISVPRALLGIGSKLSFEFKWSDNMQSHDVMDFYENGDTAPLGRFNYLYSE